MRTTEARQARLYLEDLELRDRFVSEEHALDSQQIIAFARQFDPQPFHLDEKLAEQSLFAGLAASGWHTAAITMKLLTSSLPLAGGIIVAGGDIGWPRLTRADDESTVIKVTPSRSKPDRGMLQLEALTMNQHG